MNASRSTALLLLLLGCCAAAHGAAATLAARPGNATHAPLQLTGSPSSPSPRASHAAAAAAQLGGQASTTSTDATTQWRWTWREQLGVALSALIAMLTAPGGGSGATLYMPLFSLLLGYSARDTAVITNFTVFLGAIASTLCALAQPHPVTPTRTRIDWSSVLVMTPPLMLGVVLGVLLNSTLPIWLLLSATLSAFLWSMSKVLRSYFKITKTEARKLAEERAKAAAAAPAPEQASQQQGKGVDIEAVAAAGEQSQPEQQDALAAAAAKLRAWWALQPMAVQGLTLAIMAAQVVFAAVQQAKTAKCSPAFWGLLAANCGAMLLLVLAAVATARWWDRRWAAREEQRKAAQLGSCDMVVHVVLDGSKQPHVLAAVLASPVAPPAASPPAAAAHDASWEAIVWDTRKLVCLPPCLVLVGIVCGCLGLGGGFLVTPMLLSMGLHPQVQACTSRLILFVSSFATSVLYLIAGRLPLYAGLLHGGLNLLLSPLGIWAMDAVIARTRRPSLLVLLNLARYTVGVSLLFALSAVPAFIATAQGRLPVGFALHNLCAAATHA